MPPNYLLSSSGMKKLEIEFRAETIDDGEEILRSALDRHESRQPLQSNTVKTNYIYIYV